VTVRPAITHRDRQAAQGCCEYALRNLSAAALKDVDFHAMASSFASHAADVLAADEADPTPRYPTDLTPALAEVLGQPNFHLHPIWMALREAGVEIKTRYEDEAAAALHFLIPLALAHGADWQRHAADRLIELRDAHLARPANV